MDPFITVALVVVVAVVLAAGYWVMKPEKK